MNRKINAIHSYLNIDGLIPGVRGQRAFPTQQFRNADPFLMLDHIGPELTGKDFYLDGSGHDHPHRGFETITFMFEGGMYHRDSLGNKSTLESGSVQRMNAGSGIIHGGDMLADKNTGRFHEVQLWVNNPTSEKMSKPEIFNAEANKIPSRYYGNAELKVIAGELNDMKGPINTKAKTKIAHVIHTAEGIVGIEAFPSSHKVFLYMLEGSAIIGKQPIQEFELVEFDNDGDSIEIIATESCQYLVLAGEPLNEPVAYGGPFVMNTEEEIMQAKLDYGRGLFGSIDK